MKESGGRLLFVDDDISLLQLFGKMLQGQTWESHFCSNVDDALKFLAGNEVDTIISDIKMPDKDGFDLLNSIRSCERTRQVPVIIITGDSDTGLKRKALDLGATDLLNKPIRREDLFARIRSSLQLKSYEDQLANQVEELDRRVEERTRQLEASHREVVWRLAKAAEFRDDETGHHVMRVAMFSRVLAEGSAAGREFDDLIFMTSPLHDIGKLGIPDSILLKEGRLSPQERKLMEQHCVMGAEILSQTPRGIGGGNSLYQSSESPPNPLLEMASSIALGHHERWDGSGYPRHLKGLEIPLECRIVAIADVFDALTSWRPYKPPLSDDDAVSILVRDSGKHFDPDLVEVFVNFKRSLIDIRHEFRQKESLVEPTID